MISAIETPGMMLLFSYLSHIEVPCGALRDSKETGNVLNLQFLSFQIADKITMPLVF